MADCLFMMTKPTDTFKLAVTEGSKAVQLKCTL